MFRGVYHKQAVAIKFTSRERAENEARTLERLSHPNIVAYVGLCESDPSVCFCIVLSSALMLTTWIV